MLRVIPIKQLSDNYAYLLLDSLSSAALIDPVDPSSCLAAIPSSHTLTSIISTHHHNDHTAGNKGILSLFPDIKVYGGDDRIPGLTDKVKQDDKIKMGELSLDCIATPGHTTGHICYFVGDAVFTGDALFLAGCGRFFEGKASGTTCKC
jgi:hydroxyacylglutathione hydrolase